MVAKVFLLLVVVVAAVSVVLGRHRNDECEDLCNDHCENICTDLCSFRILKKLGLNLHRNDSCIDRCDEACHRDCDVICDDTSRHRQVIFDPPPIDPPVRHPRVGALKKYRGRICVEKCNDNCDQSCSELCDNRDYRQSYYCIWLFGSCTLKKNEQCIEECDEECTEACENNCFD